MSLWRLDYEQAHVLAREVLSQALADGDRALEAAARVLCALWEARLGTVARAHRELEAASATFDRLDDAELAPWLRTFARLGLAESMLERSDSARRHMERALDVARSSGQGSVLVEVLLFLGYALHWQGDLPEATRCYEDAIASAELTGESEFLIWALGNRCWSAWQAGDSAAAFAAGERAVELSAGRADQVSAVGGFFLAEAQLEAGDPAGCRERMLEAGGGPDLPLNERLYQPRWYLVLTRAELALGDLARAEGWAERAEAAAAGLGLPGRTGWAEQARAEVLLAQGDAAGAPRSHRVPRATSARPATASTPSSPGPFTAWRSRRRVSGRWRSRPWSPPETSSRPAGALALRDQAARELRRLGRRVPRSQRDPGDGRAPPRLAEPARARDRRSRAPGQDEQADRRRAPRLRAHR